MTDVYVTIRFAIMAIGYVMLGIWGLSELTRFMYSFIKETYYKSYTFSYYATHGSGDEFIEELFVGILISPMFIGIFWPIILPVVVVLGIMYGGRHIHRKNRSSNHG